MRDRRRQRRPGRRRQIRSRQGLQRYPAIGTTHDRFWHFADVFDVRESVCFLGLSGRPEDVGGRSAHYPFETSLLRFAVMHNH
jgi:hypothetical protein